MTPLFKRRRLGVQASIVARRPRRPGKIEYGVRLGVVGVWATPFSPWATPNLGFFWRWILAPACKLARVLLCARLAAVPVRATILSPFFLCAWLFLPARALHAAAPPCARLLLAARQSCLPLAAAPRLLAASLRAPCTRLLLAARQSCSPLAAAPCLLAAAARHSRLLLATRGYCSLSARLLLAERAAAARWARGWPAAPLPWCPSLVGPPLLSLRCQHPKMMFIFPCFPWFGCLLFCNSCL
jgi:hypothetical protein